MRRYERSIREIASVLGRSPSTIAREIQRNVCRDGAYRPRPAQLMAQGRRRHVSIPFKLDRCPRLRKRVVEGLRRYWSPEQIVGRLAREGFGERVSHQTVYRYIARDRRAGGELYTYLRHINRKWRRYRSRKSRHTQGRLSGYRPVDQRPKIVQTQGRFGDWEGDTLRLGPGKRVVATFVERKSGYLMARTMEDRSAAALTASAAKLFGPWAPHACRTLTVDHGKEFASFDELEARTGAKVYFARPYCATDKPIVENANGLLRQFLPKGESFQDLDNRTLNRYVDLINNRPRKKLGYGTPSEVAHDKLVALEM
jgi:IS30 family transposase